MSEFDAARAHMIDCQLRPNEVNNETILAVIAKTPREDFVPKSKRSIAYVDEDLEIGEGRFLMEPAVFARLLTAARVTPTDLVLHVGCGTGYGSAILAGLSDAVVALEENTKLVGLAEKKLSALGVMNVATVNGDLSAGVPKQGPYDVIFIEGAVEDIPSKLVKQLKEGGRLVCVKKDGGVGRAHFIEMKDGKAEGKNLFDANVELLPGFETAKEFVF